MSSVRTALRTARAYVSSRLRETRYLTALTAAYFLVTTFLMALSGSWPTPDKFLIVGVLFALLLAKPKPFLRDWAPFVILFLAYEYLRGLVPSLGWTVNVHPLIRADEFLFGTLPTLTLQKALFSYAGPRFYDYLVTLVYMAHFSLPLGFALLLWVRDRRDFRRFLTALTMLTFAGFFTYLVYPAMPPWMAADQGLIPPVQDVMGRTISLFDRGPGLPSLYAFMAPNLVAAMPSLHAAYPAMVYLFALKFYGRRAHLFLPYAVVVWTGIVYTAQHWVVDVIVGILYALVAFGLAEYVSARIAQRRGWGKPHTTGESRIT
ncbi:MAG: phosphatase PAP2 family protein [Thermoleophilia bacterium]